MLPIDEVGPSPPQYVDKDEYDELHADYLALAKLVMEWRDATGQWTIASAKENPGDLDSAAERVQRARAGMIAAAKEVLDA